MATLTGEELERKLKGLLDSIPAQSEEALRALGQRVFDKSQERVPVDKGKLKGSGRWEITREGNVVTLRIYYGGSDAPYAIVVHEDLQAHHDNGQPKFLESALLEEMGSSGLGELAEHIDLARAA